MAIGILKDFTAYTEADPGANIVIDSATQITVTNMDNAPGGAYVYDNYGAGGIGSYWELLFQFNVTAISATPNFTWLVGVSDTLAEGASTAHVNALMVQVQAITTSTYGVVMRERAASTTYNSTSAATLNTNTTYYGVLRRYKDSNTYGSGALSIYSDAARTTKVGETSRVLHNTPTFQYMYALIAEGNNAGKTNSYVIGSQRFIPLTVQDFTTYVEQDTANDIINITANTFTISSMANNADGYLVKDFGANAIGKCLLMTTVRNNSLNAGTAPYFFMGGVAKNLGVNDAEQDGCHVRVTRGSTTWTACLAEKAGGVQYLSADITGLTGGSYYQIEFWIDPDVGTYGTAYLRISSGGLQTGMVSLALHASTGARYLYAIQAKGDATTDAQTGFVYAPHQFWYAAAAQIINASATESISLSDSSSATLNLPVAIAESVALTDTPSVVLNLAASMSESIALTDASGVTVLFVADITESLNLTESSSTSWLIISDGVVENITLTESSSATGVFTATCIEAMALSDLPSAVMVFLASGGDAMTLTDYLAADVVAGAPTVILSVIGFAASAAGTIVQYRIEQSATGAIEQDWTASGVTENPIGDGKSVYRVATNRIMASAQVTVLWRYSADSGATWSKYAQETLNILDTYAITIKQLVEALNLGSASVQLSDIHGRLALDASRPVTQSSTQISFGNVVLALALDGNGNGTVTRQ